MQTWNMLDSRINYTIKQEFDAKVDPPRLTKIYGDVRIDSDLLEVTANMKEGGGMICTVIYNKKKGIDFTVPHRNQMELVKDVISLYFKNFKKGRDGTSQSQKSQGEDAKTQSIVIGLTEVVGPLADRTGKGLYFCKQGRSKILKDLKMKEPRGFPYRTIMGFVVTPGTYALERGGAKFFELDIPPGKLVNLGTISLTPVSYADSSFPSFGRSRFGGNPGFETPSVMTTKFNFSIKEESDALELLKTSYADLYNQYSDEYVFVTVKPAD